MKTLFYSILLLPFLFSCSGVDKNTEKNAALVEDYVDAVQNLDYDLMENYLSETESHLKSESEKQSLYDYLGGLGAVKITAARLDWLRVVRTHLREK